MLYNPAMETVPQSTRDGIADEYFSQLPFAPYPVQEEALLAWFTSPQGVLVCAPTGTGKTLIAEAAVFEALKLGRTTYYTTPLIALTDQKFQELRAAAERWGFSADDIGLITGNRRVNPNAKILVVVAEILLNRLLHREAFDFSDVWAVVMDEFHNFNDLERGIVWEFSLELLPRKVKTLLLSATVGNAYPFTRWLQTHHERDLVLVQSSERKVPLSFHWVGDMFLDEQLEAMIRGGPDGATTPALVFCFNREQCWTTAELLKGKKLVTAEQQKRLAQALDEFDWSQGAGPKLQQILQRGVGVHHAGVLPKYRRIVESLFQERLLSVCVCTETLAAGINLPARSVVLPSLMKGPPDKMKLIDPSSAHQMFGRAGRPQFDNRGFVYALAHEDDVKILRWREKYDQIPEDTKDVGLLRAKKQLKKKMPRRREGVAYWNQAQFDMLVKAPAADLASRGPLPWRMLAYLLNLSPEVEPIRRLVAERLVAQAGQKQAQLQLNRMLIALWRAGYVELEPKPPPEANEEGVSAETEPGNDVTATEIPAAAKLDLGQRPAGRREEPSRERIVGQSAPAGPTLTREEAIRQIAERQLQKSKPAEPPPEPAIYRPITARATERLELLTRLRGVHPLYGLFLVNQLGIADRAERIQALESLLELPKSVGPAIRVPHPDVLPPGPLATDRLHEQLLKLGLATSAELGGAALAGADEGSDDGEVVEEYATGEYVRTLTLAEKLLRLFEYEFPGVRDARVWPVWVAGEALQFGDDFNRYITSYKLQKQEGLILRHLLRMVLLIDEFAPLNPPESTLEAWQDDWGEVADQLEAMCRRADPASTEQWLDETRAARDDFAT